MTRMACLALALTLAAGPATAQQDPIAARTKGSATAPVTVYEMSDFQCPFCRRHAIETFPDLEREYIATGKVRWVFINFPLSGIHPNAVAAAELAMCSGKQGKFWEAHDLLYLHQEVWAPLENPGPFLLSLGDSLRLTKPRLANCLEKQETREEVRLDSQGASRAGARSTPTFWIEGGMMTGAHPTAVFRQILDSIYLVKTRKP